MTDLAFLRAVVRGRVQGVFFRAHVESRAVELKLTGFVRNRPDGAVEVLAEGEREKLEKLLKYLREGSPASRVDNVDVEWGEYTGEFSGFDARY